MRNGRGLLFGLIIVLAALMFMSLFEAGWRPW
jgi:hypothetical protein